MSLLRWLTDAGRAERRRARVAESVAAGPLRDFVTTDPPDRDTDVRDAPLLAVDIETTGLDPRTDRILSVGFVALDGLSIGLATADHYVIRSEGPVGQSATVHGLTDDVVAEGVEPRVALEALLEAMSGRGLLAHHTKIETNFLAAACADPYGLSGSLPVCVVDTLKLHKRLLTGGGEQLVPTGALRLATAREAMGLPRYRPHNALTDALACAELYLAQIARIAGDAPLPLARVLG